MCSFFLFFCYITRLVHFRMMEINVRKETALKVKCPVKLQFLEGTVEDIFINCRSFIFRWMWWKAICSALNHSVAETDVNIMLDLMQEIWLDIIPNYIQQSEFAWTALKWHIIKHDSTMEMISLHINLCQFVDEQLFFLNFIISSLV